jgi:hypothetical protein
LSSIPCQLFLIVAELNSGSFGMFPGGPRWRWQRDQITSTVQIQVGSPSVRRRRKHFKSVETLQCPTATSPRNKTYYLESTPRQCSGSGIFPQHAFPYIQVSIRNAVEHHLVAAQTTHSQNIIPLADFYTEEDATTSARSYSGEYEEGETLCISRHSFQRFCRP